MSPASPELAGDAGGVQMKIFISSLPLASPGRRVFK